MIMYKSNPVLKIESKEIRFSNHLILKFCLRAFTMIKVLQTKSQAYKILMDDKLMNNLSYFWDITDAYD